MNDIKCLECYKILHHSPITYVKPDVYLCKDCSERKEVVKKTEVQNMSCENQPLGCTFRHPNKVIIRKHEYWICGFRNYRCGWCGDQNTNNMRLIDHFAIKDSKQVKPEFIGKEAYVTFRDIPFVDSWHWSRYSFTAFKTLFYLDLIVKDDSVRIFMLTDKESHGAETFEITFNIIFMEVEKNLSFKLPAADPAELDINPDAHDWISIFYIKDTLLRNVKLPNAMNCEMQIVKILTENIV